MSTRLLTACCSAVVMTAAVAAQPASLVAKGAWVREAPGSRANTAAFMTLENPSSSEVVILSASSPAAKVVELHEVRDDAGVMRMRKVDKLVVPANGSLVLKPGSFHVMLFELTGALAEGQTVSLTFTLGNGATLQVDAPVRAMGMK